MITTNDDLEAMSQLAFIREGTSPKSSDGLGLGILNPPPSRKGNRLLFF